MRQKERQAVAPEDEVDPVVQVRGDVGRLERRALQSEEALWTAVRPWWELYVIHSPPVPQEVVLPRERTRSH